MSRTELSRSSKTIFRLSVAALALLVTPGSITSAPLPWLKAAFAQSSEVDFPIPDSLPEDAEVRVDGTSSMAVLNQALKQQFTEQYPDAKVELNSGNSDEALADLINGEIDIAAIGRRLTEDEKAKGLAEVPIERGKIAIIIGSDNPYEGNISFEEFARIFRGEITDWSEVGGEPGPIRFVDRPEFSDTRRALSTYEVFEVAPFEAGLTSTPVTDDETEAVIDELGADGISYAIADQVLDQENGVRIVSMHQTLPDDPRYPYSQPRNYVYQADGDNPAAQAFLGVASSDEGRALAAAVTAATLATQVEEAAEAEAETEATPTPEATETPVEAEADATATTETEVETAPATTDTDTDAALVPDADSATATTRDGGGFPWWLLFLLGIPLLGALLWWLLGRGGDERDARQTIGTATRPEAETGTVSPRERLETDRINAAGRVDTPDVATPEVTTPEVTAPAVATPEVTTPEVTTPDINANLPTVEGAATLPETPSVTTPDVTTPSVTTPSVTTPNITTPNINPGAVGAGIAGVAAGAAGLAAWARRPRSSRITLSPSGENAHAYWTVTDSDREAIQEHGGQDFKLRLYDVTGLDLDTQPAHDVREIDCSVFDREKQIALPARDRDYLVEAGYVTPDGEWLQLARSNSMRIPSEDTLEIPSVGTPTIDSPTAEIPTTAQPAEPDLFTPVTETTTGTPGLGAGTIGAGLAGAGALAGAGLAGATSREQDDQPQPGQTEETAEVPLLGHDVSDPQCWITLRADDEQQVTARWHLTQVQRDALQQTAQPLQLLVYDITDVDVDIQAPNTCQIHNCSHLSSVDDQEYQVSVPRSERYYVAEIGHVTGHNAVTGREQWVAFARSNNVRVPELEGESADVAEEDGGMITTATTPLGVPLLTTQSRVQIEPNPSDEMSISWTVPETDQDVAKQRGGQQFQMRLHDVTGVDPETEPAHSIYRYHCDETDQNLQVTAPVSGRDYIAELGYSTPDGRWLQVARSESMRIPASDPVTPPDSTMGVAPGSTSDSSVTLVEPTVPGGGAAPETSGAIPGAAIAGGAAIAAGGAALGAAAGRRVTEPTPSPAPSPTSGVIYRPVEIPVGTTSAERVMPRSGCKIEHLTVDSKANCYILESDQIRELKKAAVSKVLQPGIYLIRIKSGSFSYSSQSSSGEPIVLLWIDGGRVMNQKTTMPVPATWSTLNGYNENLTIKVLETTTLYAFFIDTHKEDNQGEVTLSVARLYPNN
ncbi:MAG: DUF4912 domain-containing protein [Microcoleaceae cyanobacterium]